MAISEKMEKELNSQIQREFFSAYFYLSMEAYFASQNLDGFAHFFRVQAQEERDHALKMFDYVIQAGGKIKLQELNSPKSDFQSPLEVFELTLNHERFITRSIHNLVDISVQEKDYSTNAFLQWFVTEQIEEEASMDRILGKLKLIKDDGMGLLMLDAELAQRVYTPLTQTK